MALTSRRRLMLGFFRTRYFFVELIFCLRTFLMKRATERVESPSWAFPSGLCVFFHFMRVSSVDLEDAKISNMGCHRPGKMCFLWLNLRHNIFLRMWYLSSARTVQWKRGQQRKQDPLLKGHRLLSWWTRAPLRRQKFLRRLSGTDTQGRLTQLRAKRLRAKIMY